MTIKIENVAQPTGELRKVPGIGGLPWYKWRVWVDEDSAMLNQIESVEYLLHPTFPQPRRVSNDRANNFELVAGGWREFWIEATIVFTDFHEEQISYKLDFNKLGEVPVEHLISALRAEDKDVRWRAATALGDISDPKAVEALIKALGDEYKPVSYAAIEALAGIGDETVEPLIRALEILKGDEYMRVRYHGASVLGRIGNPEAKGVLEDVSEHDKITRVKDSAKDALDKIEAKQKFKVV